MRPKLLVKERDPPESGEKGQNQASDIKRTGSSVSLETAGVDSAPQSSLGVQPEVGGASEAERERQSPPPPAMRSQPKKIMLRKMSDSSKVDSDEKGDKESSKTGDRGSDPKSSQTGSGSGEQDPSEVQEGVAKPRPTAWKVSERSGVKTLYEPEGKRSEAKFRKYHHGARGTGGKKERTSPATTPSEPHPPTSVPDLVPREKAGLRRTFSGERGRDRGRRGRDRGAEEDNLKWVEPPRSHGDQQKERSVPVKDTDKGKPLPDPQREPPQERGGEKIESQRERENEESKSRSASESDQRGREEQAPPSSPHVRPGRGRGNRTHRFPSGEDRSRQRRRESERDSRPASVTGDAASSDTSTITISKETSVTAAPPTTAVAIATTTISMATVSTAPASVPQTVINKSLSVQKKELISPDLPLALPTQFVVQQSVKRPLLDDPPLALRQAPLDERTGSRRSSETAEERRRRRGEPGRGGRRGSQRGRGRDDRHGSRGGRDDRQEGHEVRPTPSHHLERERDRDRERDKDKGRERDRERGRGRGRGRDRREKPVSGGAVAEEKKPQLEGEQARRGRDRRRRGGKKGAESSAESSGRAPRRTRGAPIGDKRGGVVPEKPSSRVRVGYDTLEDIESESDWEDGGGCGQRGVAREGLVSEQPKERGRGQRSLEQQEMHRSSSRGVRGRGRGRGNTRRDSAPMDRTVRPEPCSAAVVAVTVTERQPETGHKQQEFAKYDLTSSTIAIVDDIGGQSEEPEGAVEFVEVTSKKSQKERVKKEREEKLRRSLGGEEQKKSARKSVAMRGGEPARFALKATTAWSSKGEEGSQTSSIWAAGASSTPSTDWGGPIIRPVPSAPGAELKGAELKESTPGWGTSSVSVGVIGEGLPARSSSISLSSQTKNPATRSSGYSLFSDYSLPLLGPGSYSGGTGGMLNAAVTMRLSQEHLPSSEPAALGGVRGAESEKGVGGVGTVQQSEKDLASHSTRQEESVGSSLPPRLQGGGGAVGRGRGSGRGRRGERGRRDRREQDVPGEGGKRESQHSRDHGNREKVNNTH